MNDTEKPAHVIGKKVIARVDEIWEVNQETGEEELDSQYNAEQTTLSESWQCTCGKRFVKAETAVAHVRGANK